MIGLLRRRARRSRGQALAEFALVLPIFLLVLFGIIDGGRMIFVNNQLSEAARDGARWGSVQERSTTSAGRTSIDDRVLGILKGVPDPDVTISCERNESPITDCRFGDILIVRVESDFQFATPFLGGLMGEPTLSAESKVVVNQ
jgi:hypothetical protein